MLEQLKNMSLGVVPNTADITDAQYDEILKETGFDNKAFLEVVSLQTKFNERMGLDWKDKGFDWNQALLVESVELIDSFDWAWWKSKTIDWENVEIEMLDIFSFILGKAIEDNQVNLFINILLGKEFSSKNVKTIEKNEQMALIIQDIIKTKFIASIQINNTLGAFLAWVDIWYILGYNSNDLINNYKIKYTLNHFRQDHGYNDGNYKKLWNGKEDNTYAQKFSKNIEQGENFIDELYKKLEDEYKNLIEIDKTLTTFVASNPKWQAFVVQIPAENRKLMFEFAADYQNYLQS